MSEYPLPYNSCDLSGRVALVTGASSGLGARFAEVLASQGAAVVLAARRLDRLEALADKIRASGGKALAVQMDATDADSLILGIQQYREFVGSYPTGNNAQIAKALLGQTEKKVLILAVRRSDLNDKGEILDAWRTPLQFYFSHNEVMIRSAGPNKVFEDDANPNSDDLFRCAGKGEK